MMLSDETLTEINEASSVEEKKLRCVVIGISWPEFLQQLEVKRFLDANEPTFGGSITKIVVSTDSSRIKVTWNDASEVLEELLASQPGVGQIIRTVEKHITIESKHFSDKLFEMLNESVEVNFEISDFEKHEMKRKLKWLRHRTMSK